MLVEKPHKKKLENRYNKISAASQHDFCPDVAQPTLFVQPRHAPIRAIPHVLGVDEHPMALYPSNTIRWEYHGMFVPMHRPFIALPLIAAVALVAPVAAPVAAQTPDAARAPVQSLSDGLIAIMKAGKKAGLAGRAAQIGPVVDKCFDLPLLTRLAVGPAWTDAAPADRTALIAAMRKLTVNQYAANFDSWSGQAFVIDPKVEVRGTDRVVKTKLTQPKGDTVSIAYRLRQNGSDWRIIDVFYQNSISQLTTRRADFDGIVRKGGAKALVSHVNTLADKVSR